MLFLICTSSAILVSTLAINHGRLVVLVERNKTERELFHEVVLHDETLVFITTVIVETVLQVEDASTVL